MWRFFVLIFAVCVFAITIQLAHSRQRTPHASWTMIRQRDNGSFYVAEAHVYRTETRFGYVWNAVVEWDRDAWIIFNTGFLLFTLVECMDWSRKRINAHRTSPDIS